MKNLLPILIIISSLMLSGCFSSTSNGTGEKKEEDKLHMLWSYAYDFDGGAPRVKPYIFEDLVITSGDAKITALNYITGEQIWKTPFVDFQRQLLNSTFGVSNEVITGSIVDHLLAWNARTGNLLWDIHIPDSLDLNQLSGITGTPEHFFAVSSDKYLFKISKNGNLKIFELDVRSYEATVEDNILYVGQRKGNPGVGVVSAIDPETLDVLWRFEPGEFGYPYHAAPIIENGIVYVGTTHGPEGTKNGFFALDARTGEEIWRREGMFTYSVASVGDFLYVNDAAGIYKLRKSDGSVEWYCDFEAGAGTAPIDYGYGYLYAPHSGTLHVVDAETGEIVYRLSPPDGSYFWRVTADAGRVFIQSNRYLYAFAPWGHEEPLEN